MDHMIPSPGFSIPTIETPLHGAEEEMILPSAQQHQQMQSAHHQLQSAHHQQLQSAQEQMMNNNRTPHSLMQPHTPIMLQSTPASQGPQSTILGSVTSPGIPGSVSSAAALDPEILPKLQNIVSTVNLGCKLELKKIALHARNAEFNPKRFAAVIMRIREPRTTALIFSSGKMVCTGAKSEDESRLAARKYARIVQKLGFEATFSDFKIQNMVGSCDVKFAIRLEGLALTHRKFCTYEPELFPGLIYRLFSPRVVLLIFVSGKVVLTGAKVKQEIYTAFEHIYPILKSFRRN